MQIPPHHSLQPRNYLFSFGMRIISFIWILALVTLFYIPAYSAVPLKVVPDSLILKKEKVLRFYVAFDEIPARESPDIFYGAAGDLFQVDAKGKHLAQVGKFSPNFQIRTVEGRETAGLEAHFTARPDINAHLYFQGEIRNGRGWSAKTETVEVAVGSQEEFDEVVRKNTIILPSPDLAKLEKTDYVKMREACKGDGCCLASVAAMEGAKGILLKSKESCASGWLPNMLKCPSSYRWCFVDSKKRGR